MPCRVMGILALMTCRWEFNRSVHAPVRVVCFEAVAAVVWLHQFGRPRAVQLLCELALTTAISLCDLSCS